MDWTQRSSLCHQTWTRCLFRGMCKHEQTQGSDFGRCHTAAPARVGVSVFRSDTSSVISITVVGSPYLCRQYCSVLSVAGISYLLDAVRQVRHEMMQGLAPQSMVLVSGPASGPVSDLLWRPSHRVSRGGPGPASGPGTAWVLLAAGSAPASRPGLGAHCLSQSTCRSSARLRRLRRSRSHLSNLRALRIDRARGARRQRSPVSLCRAVCSGSSRGCHTSSRLAHPRCHRSRSCSSRDAPPSSHRRRPRRPGTKVRG